MSQSDINAVGVPFTASAAAGLDLDTRDPAKMVLPPVVMTYSGQRYAVSGRAALAPSGQAAPAAAPKWYESRGTVFALSVVLLLLAAFAAWRFFQNEHSSA